MKGKGGKGKSKKCKVFNMKKPLTGAEMMRLVARGETFRVFKEAAVLKNKADVEAWLEGTCDGQIGTLNAPFKLRPAQAAS